MYIGYMKYFILTLLVMVVWATADVYPIYQAPIEKRCERIKYDTKAQRFIPEDCMVRLGCTIDSADYGENVEVYARQFPKMKPKFLLRHSNGVVVEINPSLFAKLFFRDNDPQQFCSYENNVYLLLKEE